MCSRPILGTNPCSDELLGSRALNKLYYVTQSNVLYVLLAYLVTRPFYFTATRNWA